MGEGGCEPCMENGTAYFGNNLFSDPVSNVENQHKCRALCHATQSCNYFTYDASEKWCYLKHKKNKTLQEPKNGPYLSRFISGTKSCLEDEENEIEEIKSLEKEKGEAQEYKKSKSERRSEHSGVPLLSIQHPGGYRTVLSTLPATFGMKIHPDTKISGRVEFASPPTLCSSSRTIASSHVTSLGSSSSPGAHRTFVAVDRGGCKFTEKAALAAAIGYGGVVVMDNKNDTNVKKISGDHLPNLERIPVIFLLKKDAEIFRNLLMENPNMKIMIEDSSTFTWSGRRTTPPSTTRAPLIGMREPSLQWPERDLQWRERQEPSLQWLLKHPASFRNRFIPRRGNRGQNNPRVAATQVKQSQTVIPPDPVVKTYTAGGGLHLSPLTLGSLVVGVVLALLLIISVSTLIVGRHSRKARRRAHSTRCQIAVRDFERQRQAQDNGGYDGDQDQGGGKGDAPMPSSAKLLLECPVCLDLAWPPTRIFQCREGHIVCENCKSNSNLRVCPMCRIPLTSNNVSRNRQLEELARTLLMDFDNCALTPSAPELNELPTISANIPHNVFTVDPQLNQVMEREEQDWIREFGVNQSDDPEGGIPSAPNAGGGGSGQHIADIVLEPRPLTVMLPPETNGDAN